MENRKPLCIYHGGCADGFTAAWAVWKRFGDSFDYHPGIYQNAPPDVKGRDVLLVDFSYKRDVLKQMARSARSILVLDHHKSADEDLWASDRTGIPSADPPPHVRCFSLDTSLTWETHMFNATADQGHGLDYCEIYTLFDMDRSGAGLTWDFFHKGELRPHLVNYVEDRDLWRFKLEHSREVNAYIFAHGYTFEQWDLLDREMTNAKGVYGPAQSGAAIEMKHKKDVIELVSELRYEMAIGGHHVPVANLPKTLTSDAGHLMCQPYHVALTGVVSPPFAACYWDTAEGRVFSLRSVGDFDVSEIAKKYGGGGHKNAAGFRLPHGVAP